MQDVEVNIESIKKDSYFCFPDICAPIVDARDIGKSAASCLAN